MNKKPALPPVTVVEITAMDDDGIGHAIPAESRLEVNSKIQIHVLPDKKPGRDLAPGMRALVRLKKTAKHIFEARIIKRIDSHHASMFGIAHQRRDGTWQIESVARAARSPLQLEAPDKKISFADGDMLEAEIVRVGGKRMGRRRDYAPRGSEARSAERERTITKSARAVKNLGQSDSPDSYAILAIAEFGIRHHFDDAVLAEVKAVATPPILDDAREDLRDVQLVTIDGEDAKDFDDAVFAEAHEDGHRLIIAIADVAHYVRAGGALDTEARLRGNSVYLPGRVVPMLPEALSNGLCSLVPHEDRACLAAEIIIDADGRKKSHRFFRGLMRSSARLTYEQVEAYRLGDKAAIADSTLIDNLLAAYESLARYRTKRGALELDLPERRVQFDDDGNAIAISKKSQTIAMKIIEECMITANVAAAETLSNAKSLCVFRAHEPPAREKIESLYDLTRVMQLPFAKGQVVRPQHFNALLAEAAKKTDAASLTLLNETILRCQSQADYRITNPGHFGLALKHYAHFTSPIRRYADLMVHRALLDHIAGRKTDRPSRDEAAEVAAMISETERIATAAERRTTDRFAAHLARAHLGKEATGRITAITGFGAFVEVGGAAGSIEGLLPYQNLPDDYYEADPMRGIATGLHTGLTLKSGDEVVVRIAEVIPVKGLISLDYVAGGRKGKPGGRRKSRGRRQGRKRRY